MNKFPLSGFAAPVVAAATILLAGAAVAQPSHGPRAQHVYRPAAALTVVAVKPDFRAGPRDTIPMPALASVPTDGLLASLNVEPALTASEAQQSTACRTHRAGPRNTIRACR
jgi:hypothetical protein